jgi:hypothetical protein
VKFIINDQVVLLRAPEGPLAPYIVKVGYRAGIRALFAAEADSDRGRFQPMACREVGPFAQGFISAF